VIGLRYEGRMRLEERPRLLVRAEQLQLGGREVERILLEGVPLRARSVALFIGRASRRLHAARGQQPFMCRRFTWLQMLRFLRGVKRMV
jgi:hypothetical protein